MELPCASILKPVYAGMLGNRSRSLEAELAIQHSSNSATDTLIEMLGGLTVVHSRLSDVLPGIAFDPERKPSWGTLMVDNRMIRTLYEYFVEPNEYLLDLMRGVENAQRLGVRQDLPVKAGWDLWPDSFSYPQMLFTRLVTVWDDGVSVDSWFRHVDDDEVLAWKSDLKTNGSTFVLGAYHNPLIGTDWLHLG